MGDGVDDPHDIAYTRNDERAAGRGTAMKRCLIVTGMHRSGTSALSRTLNLLGARMGYSLQESATDNVKGFWEPSEVIAIHEQLFADIAFCHDTYLGLADSALHSEAAAVARRRLRDFVEHAFSADDTLVIIKDPRICRLIPLWREVLAQAGFEADIVIPIRNPLEVARSLHVRNGYHVNKGLLMWLRHVLAAERDSRECRRTIVTYDQLMSDWRHVAAQIGRDLDIDWPRDREEAAAEIDTFLDASLRHHRVTDGEPQTELVWVADAWQAMRGLADRPQERSAVLDRIFEEMARAEGAFAALDHSNEDAHAGEIAELHATIRSREAELEQARCLERELRTDLAAAQLQAAGLVAMNASQRESQERVLRNCEAMSKQMLAQVSDVIRDAVALRTEWASREAQINDLVAGVDRLADQVKTLKRRLLATDRRSLGAGAKRSGRRPRAPMSPPPLINNPRRTSPNRCRR